MLYRQEHRGTRKKKVEKQLRLIVSVAERLKESKLNKRARSQSLRPATLKNHQSKAVIITGGKTTTREAQGGRVPTHRLLQSRLISLSLDLKNLVAN